jgi:hypothetical protein
MTPSHMATPVHIATKVGVKIFKKFDLEKITKVYVLTLKDNI